MDGYMVRQGDVLVRRCPETAGRTVVGLVGSGVAAVAPENGRLVLAHGEVTGHHHSIALSPRVTMFRADDGNGGPMHLVVSGDAPVLLEHQEHTALPIPPGAYQVIRQRVYSAGVAARVAD